MGKKTVRLCHYLRSETMTSHVVLIITALIIIIHLFKMLFPPGTVLGAGDARSSGWCEVEEGSGASVQPAAYRIPAHTVRDADGRHPLQALQVAKSHGKDLTNLHRPSITIFLCLAVFYVTEIGLNRHESTSRLMLMSFQVNGDIPPRLKKSAHEIILEFIRSRPPLNPVSSVQHDASDLSIPHHSPRF